MKKILLITLIFILQSFPSFGNSIDGKGLVCNSFRDRSFDKGFFFEERTFGKDIFRVKQFQMGLLKDKYRLEISYYHDYKTTKDYIMWSGKYWTLDRESLLLYENNLTKPKYICEVYNSKDLWMGKLNSIKEKLQNDYDEEMKDNKI